MNGKLYHFPILKKPEPQSLKILYLKSAEQARIIDLAEQGRRIRAIQKEIGKLKARSLMRIVNNEGIPGKT